YISRIQFTPTTSPTTPTTPSSKSSTPKNVTVKKFTPKSSSPPKTLSSKSSTPKNNTPKISTTPTITSSGRKRMGKTTTKTTKRTYNKDGKVYEETVVEKKVEGDDGSVTTTTNTTTRVVGDSFNLTNLSEAIEGAKYSRGCKDPSTSSSSSDKQKDKDKKAVDGLIKPQPKPQQHQDDDDEIFAKAAFNRVNEYRVKHGVAKLKLSKEMCRYAKIWASKMAESGTMSHDPEKPSMDRIFTVNPEETVDKWYSESNNHKFGEEPKSGLLNTGHFTQLVWKDTTPLVYPRPGLVTVPKCSLWLTLTHKETTEDSLLTKFHSW
ncbi:hypothetical protein Pcinc_040829, partial [Petrolisthes cinctipes]